MLGPLDKPEEVEVKQEPTETPGLVNSITDEELVNVNLARSLGIDKLTKLNQYTNDLNRLAEWAKVKGAKDIPDIIWSVRSLAARIGSPSVGENIVTHLSRYAFLELERLRLESEMKKFEVK